MTLPPTVAGLAWAAVMAARAKWRACGTALAVAVVGALGVLAGPVGARAVAGIGLCVALLASAAAIALAAARVTVCANDRRRARPADPRPSPLADPLATLAALDEGDTLSFTRLQDMIGLTPGNLIIHLRKLEDADYVSSQKDGQRGPRPEPRWR